MMALELLDTKVGGVIQPDPGSAQAGLVSEERLLDRSETCSLVMMLDAWLCTVLGLTPSASRLRLCPGPSANNPRTSVSLGELGEGDEVAARPKC